jgi:hypothetical protein
MTSPQDPNQPGQPGAPGAGDAGQQGWGQQPQTPGGAGPSPDQPGWAAPPPAAQPGWGAPPPPPAQPGWGAPPPPPAQPGWGAPPPAGQPGWGAPPPAGQQGWAPQPGWGAPPRTKGHGCLIAFLIVIGALVLVGGCTALVLGPFITTDIKLYSDLGTNRVSNVTMSNTNGTNIWIIHLKAGYDSQDEANNLACTIVKPDLAGTQFKNDEFQLIDHDGYLIVDSNTLTCP